jgi:acyl-lipid omega-6 desaturase (Delta-12 desaturase)
MALSDILSPTMDVDAFRPENLPKVAKLAAYAKPEAGRSLFQLLTTAALFAGGWFAMYKSLALPYWATLLLAVPTGGLLVRLFIFQHDAGHGSFFASKRANDLTGFCIGVLTLTPYQFWQKTHAIHHATSGNLDERGFGDIDTLTVREYRSLSPREQLKYRAYRHPLTMFLVGPLFQFMIKHRWPWNVPFSWKREWRSVHLTNLALAGVLALAAATIGLKSFFLVQLPVTFISCAIGAWLFYIQHQYDTTYWERDDRWDYFQASMQGSSYYVLPKVLQWFSGNIGLHHIHHYNSRIPNYKLQACYDENPEFRNVTKLTILSSLHCIRLALWDEERKELVSFRDLERPRQRLAA